MARFKIKDSKKDEWRKFIRDYWTHFLLVNKKKVSPIDRRTRINLKAGESTFNSKTLEAFYQCLVEASSEFEEQYPNELDFVPYFFEADSPKIEEADRVPDKLPGYSARRKETYGSLADFYGQNKQLELQIEKLNFKELGLIEKRSYISQLKSEYSGPIAKVLNNDVEYDFYKISVGGVHIADIIFQKGERIVTLGFVCDIDGLQEQRQLNGDWTINIEAREQRKFII